jgi:hypothetical protein
VQADRSGWAVPCGDEPDPKAGAHAMEAGKILALAVLGAADAAPRSGRGAPLREKGMKHHGSPDGKSVRPAGKGAPWSHRCERAPSCMFLGPLGSRSVVVTRGGPGGDRQPVGLWRTRRAPATKLRHGRPLAVLVLETVTKQGSPCCGFWSARTAA